MSSQNGADGFVAKRDTPFGKFTGEFVVAPVSILACQSHYEPFSLFVGTGPTTLHLSLISPLAANELTVPFEDCFWSKDAQYWATLLH